MGYETTLLIGKDTKEVFENYTYFMIIATLDLGKISHSNLLLLPWENPKSNITQWEFLIPVGNEDTIVREDRYNKCLQPIPIQPVIKALEKDIRRNNYRPAVWAVALLNKIQDEKLSNEEYSVLLYGH